MDKSRNIILVDDDPVTIQLCNMIFKRSIPHARIFVFENGLEAAEWIDNEGKVYTRDDNFILLLDLNMPVMNGWEFLEVFEKLDEATQQKFSVHILTSSLDDRDIDRSKKHPSVQGFHSKPLTHKMIEQIFARYDASQV